MSERPIIFSAPMVRALIDGRKTQTRRILGTRGHCNIFKPGAWSDSYVLDPGNAEWRARDTPYAVGDRLWVRETFFPRPGFGKVARPHYRADPESDRPEWRGLWKPSIHMPRWASRLTLIVTDLRVQRLQEISEADAIAEGIDPLRYPGYGGRPQERFQGLWDNLNVKRDFGWESNPWVVALTFDVIKKNIDTMRETRKEGRTSGNVAKIFL